MQMVNMVNQGYAPLVPGEVNAASGSWDTAWPKPRRPPNALTTATPPSSIPPISKQP